MSESFLPVYFGQNLDLYGCFHASARSDVSSSLLICQPTGHEYERCHRAMRQLAVQASRKGLPAMRFDYYATGNSAGNCDELNMLQMRKDTQQAVSECLDKSGTERLTLVGLRLGATLAGQLANTSNDVDSLVLYAPILDAQALLAEWQQEQHSFYAKHSHMPQQAVSGEILGFPVTDSFQQEVISELSSALSSSSLRRVLILVDEADMGSPILNKWLQMYQHHGIDVTLEGVDNIAIWRREPMDAIVPIKVIRRIVKWIDEN